MKDYIKSILWGAAGLIVSIPIIGSGRVSVAGYPLLVLSILMFVLALSQFLRTRKK